MKKIVGIVAAASLVAGLAFADGPTANLAVTDFTGNAQVQWGVDLDSGTTGFKNSEYMKFVINLFDAGEKATSSDNDVWAELVMKAGNCKSWTHKLFAYDSGVDFTADGYQGGLNDTGISIDIDTAKIHFGDFYVGILNGDTQTGEYKVDSAIRGYDHWKGQGKWLTNVGPYEPYYNKDGEQAVQYSQGIVAGFANSNLSFDVDFRSNPFNDAVLKADGSTDKVNYNQYTSNYAVALEAQLKDSNEWVEGLGAGAGFSVNLSDKSYAASDLKIAGAADPTKDAYGWVDADNNPATAPVWGVTAAGKEADTVVGSEAVETKDKAKIIGYSGNVGYKFKIDDKYWFKPYAALTGTYWTQKTSNPDVTRTGNGNNVVFGAMLGWGSAQDANGGVYYFDADHQSRKVCSGVSVVATVPLADKTTTTTTAGTTSKTDNDLVKALIVPSFYTKGDLVEGLTAAVYSEMALLRSDDKDADDGSVTYTNAADKDDTFALALAAALAYDIKADEITVTPQAGFRFVNTAYADNKIGGYSPLSNDPFFTNLGAQKKVADAASKRNNLYENGFFNLKAGVNVNGLINNTDIFAVYQSANLLNGIDYSVNKNADGTAKKFYNVKLGTFNVGCKISL